MQCQRGVDRIHDTAAAGGRRVVAQGAVDDSHHTIGGVVDAPASACRLIAAQGAVDHKRCRKLAWAADGIDTGAEADNRTNGLIATQGAVDHGQRALGVADGATQAALVAAQRAASHRQRTTRYSDSAARFITDTAGGAEAGDGDVLNRHYGIGLNVKCPYRSRSRPINRMAVAFDHQCHTAGRVVDARRAGHQADVLGNVDGVRAGSSQSVVTADGYVQLTLRGDAGRESGAGYFVRADVVGCALRPGDAPLVGCESRVPGVDGWAPGQQGVGLRRTAVVCQRAEERVLAGDVVRQRRKRRA